MRPMFTVDRLESGAVGPSAPGGQDWILAGLVAAISVAEMVVREDVFRPLAAVVALLLAAAILWRRVHPLPSLIVVFGSIMAADVVSVAWLDQPFSLYAGYAGWFVLVLVYSLLRRSNVLRAVIGMVVVLLTWAVAVAIDGESTQDAVGGVLLLLLVAALGLTMRYRAIILMQRFEQVRSRERENLARELHDTVAHHVSAIAIQAQAGRFLASSNNLDGAIDALQVIEQESSMTLADMRAMVGALRRDGTATDQASPHDLSDIDAMATTVGLVAEDPVVEVERRGRLNNLSGSVETTLHRVAQESVTNARKHARRPTRITVLIDGMGKDVHITVSDDGERVPSNTSPTGYGLVGMTERVALLGGTLRAGPSPDAGWRVEATMPRDGRRP